MNASQMIQRVKDRSHHNDDTKIIGEINSAKDWAYTDIYNSEGGPDLLMTFDAVSVASGTMAAQTRTYDLGANVSGTLYGIKTLWLKFSNDTNFTKMQPLDAGSATFRSGDVYPATDTTSVAMGHPVFYEVFNFSKLRFSPPLPASSVIRADCWLKPPDIDPTTNNLLTYGADIPEPVHEAIVDKATAQIFNMLDDSRWQEWEAMAERRLSKAMHLMRQRSQGPVSTQPFRARRKRYI